MTSYNIFDVGFFTDALLGGLVGSIATWIFVTIFKRLYSFCRLIRYRGNYSGLSMQEEPHAEDKEYIVRFNFIKNRLKLSQTSNEHGSWKAYIKINDWNPKVGQGNFHYLEGGKYRDGWGVMQIWLGDDSITIESTPRNKQGKGIQTYKIKRNLD